MYSVALVMAYLVHGWEQKLTFCRFATHRFGCILERFFSVSRDKVSNWEYCILNLCPWLVLLWFNAFFSSWALVPTHIMIFNWGIVNPVVLFINEVNFSCQWRAVVFTCWTKLYMAVCRYRISFLMFNWTPDSWAIQLNTGREIPYLHVPSIVLYLISFSKFEEYTLEGILSDYKCLWLIEIKTMRQRINKFSFISEKHGLIFVCKSLTDQHIHQCLHEIIE